MLQSVLQTLNDTALAETIRENELVFPWLESIHVLAITLVLGSIAVVDLRLLGLASMRWSVTALIRQVLPVTWIAYGFALLTGAAMFASNAVAYAKNLPFLMKMALMLVAGINMLFFHFVTYRGVARWNESLRTPVGARCAGAFSVVLWIAIVACGRWIGFTIEP